MPVVSKRWDFTGSMDGFTEVEVSIYTRFYLYTGSALAVTYDFGYHEFEKTRTGVGVTWETWGVPQGATVLSVNANFTYRTLNGAILEGGGWKLRVLDSSGSTRIHSAGDIYSNETLRQQSWTFQQGVSRNVDASYQASTTGVRMEIEGRGGVWYDGYDELIDVTLMDYLNLDITYSSGGYNVAQEPFTFIGEGVSTA